MSITTFMMTLYFTWHLSANDGWHLAIIVDVLDISFSRDRCALMMAVVADLGIHPQCILAQVCGKHPQFQKSMSKKMSISLQMFGRLAI